MERNVCKSSLRLLPAILALLIMVSACRTTTSKPVVQKSFSSPQQAVAALVAAIEHDSDAELLAVLGPAAEELISSGDPVADKNGRARFLTAYQKQNSIDQTEDDRAVLVVGGKDYPFPIPIVGLEDGWRFDTEAGREEILSRRIGRNELRAIEVLHAYIDAQREYACLNTRGTTEFAQRFASSPGQKDGLYWEAQEGEATSPFGPLIAQAAEKGYAGGLARTPQEPYRGYYFKILTSQGMDANGGAFDYVVDGRMVLGFALVAYPAKYGASGIMTFMVNQEGIIYEKDLGEETANVATAMESFNPDPTWQQYQEAADEAR